MARGGARPGAGRKRKPGAEPKAEPKAPRRPPLINGAPEQPPEFKEIKAGPEIRPQPKPEPQEKPRFKPLPRSIERLQGGKFAPGNTAGLGRPKGSRHKISESFLADVLTDWELFGAACIVELRETRVADYVKVVAALLPKEMTVRVNELEEATDDELAALVAKLRADVAAAEAEAETGEGGNAPSSSSEH